MPATLCKGTAHILTPGLLREVETDKLAVSQQQGREVLLAEAIDNYVERHPGTPEERNHAAFNRWELEQIRNHKWIESERAGRDIGGNAAAIDWLGRFGRDHGFTWQSLETHGFASKFVQARKRVAGRELTDLARTYDATSYLHEPGIRPTFLLETVDGVQPYVDLRSASDTGELMIYQNDKIMLVGYGNQAQEVLKALENILRE